VIRKLHGGKFPVINLLLTSLVFCGLAYYRFSCRLKNILKRKPAAIKVPALSQSKSELAQWFEKGLSKFNIGGGNIALTDYVNVDFVKHEAVAREIIADIRDLSFFPSGSATQIHSSHVLEHLTSEYISGQLKEYHRILKPEGLLSIRCPNALGVCYGFWFTPVHEDEHDAFIKLGFPADESFGDPADAWGHKDLFALFHWLFGDIGNIENQHLAIITPSKLQEMLKNAGFEVVKCTKPEAINIAIIAKKI
jgi:SAM-dependent methyltransferase